MKHFLVTIGFCTIFISQLFSQTISELPVNVSYASAEVWGDSIYFFGGSFDYAGTELYKRIYKFNGVSWSYYDTIPFNHVWGLETALKGDSVFVFGGWSGGSGKLYVYRLSTKTWTQLTQGPGTFSQYGHTLEYFNGSLYAFYNGYAAKYDPSSNTWTNLATNNQAASFSASTIFNGEIYISGWSLSLFFKYNPSTNQWTQLQDLPEFLSGGALRAIDNKIYLVGGSTSFGGGTSLKVYVYNPATNQWSLDARSISSKRAYMEDVLYKNKFYILGGMDESSQSVKIVEYVMDQTTDAEEQNIVPTNFSLEQNYPNPFNPSTKIRYSIPDVGSGLAQTVLKVYDILGNEVATLVNEEKPAGVYEVEFSTGSFGNASNLSSGMYIYRLQIGDFSSIKKMSLIK